MKLMYLILDDWFVLLVFRKKDICMFFQKISDIWLLKINYSKILLKFLKMSFSVQKYYTVV